MTIICYKDNILAADKQITMNHTDSGSTVKIRTPEPGENWGVYGKRIIAVGVAGAVSYAEMVISALRIGVYADSVFPPTIKINSFVSVMVITEDYKPWILDADFSSDEGMSILVLTNGEQSLTSTIGSRRVEALVRLQETDATAEEVVLKISEKGHGCGGGVDTLDVKRFHKKLLKDEEKLPEGFEFKPSIMAFKYEQRLKDREKELAEEKKQKETTEQK